MGIQIFSQQYKIASYLVNLRGQAGLYSVLNLIQDVGWMHAVTLNVRLPKGHGWVFTRQKLVMQEWPAWNEAIEIRTWLRPPTNDFISRDYEILKGGHKIGEGAATFAVMDMSTRKLAPQDWQAYSSSWRSEGHLQLNPGKVPWNEQADELAKFQVRNSDIDLNHHVNNTKYAQWILDSLPIEILREGAVLLGYEVNFMAESKIGDLISVQKVRQEQKIGPVDLIQFQGVRIGDRKPVFAAQMQVQRSLTGER